MKTLLLLFLFSFPPSEPILPDQDIPVYSQVNPYALSYVAEDPGKKKKLLEKVSEQALVALTNNKNVGIRCSAFLGLVKLDSDKVKEIFLDHLEDDERLVLGGLWNYVADYEKVNQFMLEQLHPERSKSSFKLTTQEYDKYRKLLYEQ
ncbi:hypothetical protein [Sabulibacter ruber]|uniref:hypothetical protein n=1 Tax=Sabulibacter ruber TaxID=2811901 RepID=UPI001A976AC1|nr:hypothetical protein [Sabulibacter ruber]